MHHRVVVVEGNIGSCGRIEKCETQFEAENRAKSLEHSGFLARAESVDEIGTVIPMPLSIKSRMMRNLYPSMER